MGGYTSLMRLHTDANHDRVAVLDMADVSQEGVAADILDRFEAAVDDGVRCVIVDCSKLDFISSGGIGVLIRIHHRLQKRGGEMKVAGISGVVLQALQVTRLDRVFDIHPTVEDAQAACGAATTGKGRQSGAPSGSPA